MVQAFKHFVSNVREAYPDFSVWITEVGVCGTTRLFVQWEGKCQRVGKSCNLLLPVSTWFSEHVTYRQAKQQTWESTMRTSRLGTTAASRVPALLYLSHACVLPSLCHSMPHCRACFHLSALHSSIYSDQLSKGFCTDLTAAVLQPLRQMA